MLLAELQLSEGTRLLLVNKSEASDRLKQAMDNFSGLKDATEPMLRQRSLFGLARANEGRGHVDTAVEQYKTLADTWPDGPYGKLAARRAKQLKTREARFL